MRVAIFWNYLFDYRVPFYERLATSDDIELTVFHGGPDPNRRSTVPTLKCDNTFRDIQIRTREGKLWGAVIYLQSGMWKYLLKENFDVIICEGNFGILSNCLIALYCRLRNTRLLYWVAGWERRGTRGFAALLRRIYIRSVARGADGYLCYGTAATRFLASYGISGPTTVVQNTIDTDRIALDCARYGPILHLRRTSLGLEGKLVILTVGALIPRKNIQCLLEAYRLIRRVRSDVALIIVGDGPEKQALVDKTVRDCLPDVHFVGEVVDEVGEYFLLSDVFVLPGMGGLAINQAMAYGLPVVCAEGDGTEHDLLIPDITGLQFIKNDAPDLAATVLLLLSDGERRGRLSAGARQHIYEHASMTRMVERFRSAIT